LSPIVEMHAVLAWPGCDEAPSSASCLGALELVPLNAGA
jgi:hypothetical protein